MLLHRHFLIGALFTYLVEISLFPESSQPKLLFSALIAGLFSSLIDLDLYFILLFKYNKEKNLKSFRRPLRIYREYEMLEKDMIEKGFVKTGFKTHLTFSAAISILSFYLLNSYFTPIVLGLTSHLLSDAVYASKVLFEKRGDQE